MRRVLAGLVVAVSCLTLGAACGSPATTDAGSGGGTGGGAMGGGTGGGAMGGGSGGGAMGGGSGGGAMGGGSGGGATGGGSGGGATGGGSGGAEYAGLTPTLYAAPTALGDGSGSSEANAMSFQTARTTVTAGAVVGMLPGVYTATPITPSRHIPAWNPTNSGTATAPIRFVAKHPAASNGSTPALWTELRSGGAQVANSSPAFGCSGRDYIHWIGQYVNEANSYTAVDTGPVVVLGTGCVIELCRVVGAGAIFPPGELHNGIRIDGGGANIVRRNVVSGFYSDSVNSGNANGAGILIVAGGALTVENNEVHGCSAGFFCKRNGPNPGTLIVRDNYFHDLRGVAVRIDANNPPGTTTHPAEVYRNLAVNCGSAGVSFAAFAVAQSSSTGSTSNVTFQNNTAVNCGSGLSFMLDPIASAGLRFWNNIVSGGSGAWGSDMSLSAWGAVAADSSRLDAEHQVYHAVGAFTVGDMPAVSLATWQGTYGQDSSTPPASTANPSFVGGAGVGAYRLQASSPALMQGRDLLGITGTAGATIPAGCYLTGNETIGTGY